MKSKEEALAGIEIFADLTEADRQAVARRMKRRSCGSGELLFKEGEDGDQLYVVLSGAVAITVKSQGSGDIRLSEIGAGSFFGEMAIIERAPRSASCQTIVECELLTLHSDDFLRLIRRQPRTSARILRRMVAITAGRLERTGSLLSQMVRWGEGARRRAVTDEATGLFNRRFYDEALDGIFRRAEVEGTPLALAMFDLDRFGNLNKSYGQTFGDRLILESADVFRGVFAEGDILVRYGGDEFTFVLPGRDADTARRLCEAVNRRVRELRFTEHPRLRLTCSLGVAAWPEHAATLTTLKEKADQALYQAKEQGRDRTAVAGA